MKGEIQLPAMKYPPLLLQELIYKNDRKSCHFLKNIRSYNNMFSFTSMGANIDRSLNTGSSPPVFRIYGQNYHKIGTLVPPEGSPPQFAQLYIYDTENEVSNRMMAVRYVLIPFLYIYIISFALSKKLYVHTLSLNDS